MCASNYYSTIFLIRFFKFIFYLLIIFEHSCTVICTESIRSMNVVVWGPGLEPDKIVLPVRHFYIQPVDLNNHPLNTSSLVGLSVNIFGESTVGKCRTRIELIDRLDLYIVRYKVFGVCWNFEIHVTYKQSHVSDSPYRILSNVYSEKCFCPQEVDKWLNNNMCEHSYEQINNDLKPFTRVNFSMMRTKILSTFATKTGSVSLCHFAIKNSRIYRKCYGQHTGFKMFVDALLSTLIRLVKLPDMEFIVNLGDWPLVKKNNVNESLPIFSWCGSRDTLDIVMPTYDLTESSIEAMSRVSIDILNVQKTKVTWNEKRSVAFWRGRDSRIERLHLVDIARKNPHLFNVSLTNFFFFRDKETAYGPKSPHISFFEFFNYKYQLNIDGTVAAYRLPYLLAGNSLVFKQDSPFYEHFYHKLQSMHHYVPIKRDLSDLVKKISWAKENDDIAKKISQNSQQFVNDNLTADKILCYHVTLFKEWTKRQISEVEVQDDMEEIAVDNNECNCMNMQGIRSEL